MLMLPLLLLLLGRAVSRLLELYQDNPSGQGGEQGTARDNLGRLQDHWKKQGVRFRVSGVHAQHRADDGIAQRQAL